MGDKIKISFETRLVDLAIADVVSEKEVGRAIRNTSKYKTISASVLQVGIIEPPVVTPHPKRKNKYLLLDGAIRLAVLKDLGKHRVQCLIAKDDESVTYNKHVNRLATVQEHRMITRALDKGVSEEKLAEALNVDIKLVKRRKTLLDGVAPEVIEMLKDKSVNPATFDALRKMRPMRQIEAAEMMRLHDTYTARFAKVILNATNPDDLVKTESPRRIKGTPDQMAMMENELKRIQENWRAANETFANDMFHLVIASAHISKILSRPALKQYLATDYPEILEQFEIIAAAIADDKFEDD